MNEPIDRPDDSLVTWRDLREAVSDVIDFQMKIYAMSMATIKDGREASLQEEAEALKAAAKLEAVYKIDELRK